MTKAKKDSTVVVLTFKKGQDIPTVTMNSHLYLDIKKIDIAKNLMTKQFFLLAGAASSKAQAERRKAMSERQKTRIDPNIARLETSKDTLDLSFHKYTDDKLTENTDA